MIITHPRGLSKRLTLSIVFSIVSRRICEQLKASPFFALIVDETTNIAVVKDVVVYARYLDQKRKVRTSFIAKKEAVDGCAETIVAV